MAMRDIPRENWRTFLDEFNRRHAGWLATIEVADRAGLHVEVRDRPLRGITVDAPRADGTRALTVLLDGPRQHFARVLGDARRVVLVEDPAGAPQALVFYPPAGARTIVQVRPPQARASEPDLVKPQEVLS